LNTLRELSRQIRSRGSVKTKRLKNLRGDCYKVDRRIKELSKKKRRYERSKLFNDGLFPYFFKFILILFSWRWKTTSKQETTDSRKDILHVRGIRKQYTPSGRAGHVSPAIVEKYLSGMHYPAEKQKLIDNAQNKGAPRDVIDLINKLP